MNAFSKQRNALNFTLPKEFNEIQNLCISVLFNGAVDTINTVELVYLAPEHDREHQDTQVTAKRVPSQPGISTSQWSPWWRCATPLNDS